MPRPVVLEPYRVMETQDIDMATTGGVQRRAPGPHASRPRVGEAMRRSVAAFDAAVAMCPTLDTASLVGAFCQKTSFCAAGEVRDLVIDTGVDVAFAVGVDVSVFELREVLNKGFNEHVASVADSDVSSVVKLLGERGLDGERLAWAVINVESLRHIALVRKEAHKAARVWDRQAEDLETYGWRGLRLALRSYQPDQWLLSTYACPKIRGAIHDGVRSEHHLPKRLTTFVNKVERERDALLSTLGRHPTPEELSEKVGVHLDKLKSMAHLAAPTSLDESDDERGGRQVADGLDVGDAVETHLRAEAVRAAVETLSREDAEAVQLLVVEGCSYAEARRRTGVSQRQLRARKDRGLRELASALSEWQ